MKVFIIGFLGVILVSSCTTIKSRNIASTKSHCIEVGYNLEDIESSGEMVSKEEADAAIVLASKYGTLPILKENTVLSFKVILEQSGVIKRNSRVFTRVDLASYMSESFLDVITAFECYQK